MQTKLSDGSVIICGILGKDAEYKQVGEKNSSLTKFGVKVGERNVQGQDKPQAIWVNVQCWHSVARAAQAFKKLDTVLVVGKIEKRQYTASDGTQKTDTHINAEFVIGMPNVAVASSAPQLANLDGFEDAYDVLGDTDGCPF